MTHFIELNMILSTTNQASRHYTDRFNDSDEDVSLPAEAAQVLTMPRMVNVDTIRLVNPRKDNRPGSRIIFTMGRGFAVTEPYETVRAMLRGEEVVAAPAGEVLAVETPADAPVAEPVTEEDTAVEEARRNASHRRRPR